ncbi:hypothetical protein B0A49_02780 [Cryomyces minteri]|uniref:Sm domain-containing protein n=1 Tax=Cryomyces minteri TaxID=331657 RepID=A0A4U0XBT1_9PEZI|nr:hypothetical protein B0A49_06206 [Cryomyces minteri]TKA77553.1 hypothetical protein B0A49_02780 [Cryomyces minteri]
MRGAPGEETGHSDGRLQGDDNDNAVVYLSNLLNKELHIHITDGRMFVGALKCTDKYRNVILSCVHEYRSPSRAAVEKAAAKSSDAQSVTVDMTSRFVGLVTIPGEHITKVEVED